MPSPAGAVRWGILAPGRISRKFAAALGESRGAQLVAVGSRDAARAAAFAQFAVDAYACSDEQRNGRRESGQQDDNTEALPGTFAELVGNEEACSRADGHFGDGSQ